MRVLLAEDHRVLARTIATGLRRQAMAVDLAVSGDEAERMCLLTDYDVLILDRDLPVMTGDEVCWRLRELTDLPRILMLTAAGEITDKVYGLTALLLLARSDRGLEETETVDLSAAARLVAAELAAQAEEGQVDVAVTSDRPLTVLGDPLLLRHLLTNLIRNAIQYNHSGGRVRVRLEDHTLTVANTGPTVPADRVPDLFEPFRRLDQDRVGTTGHGLGLAIVRSIAEAHGTEATAEPGRPGGLTVTVRFP
ncbi:hybrid sensor histidine kinase/response regulator [Streptomyces sp. NPDC004051]